MRQRQLGLVSGSVVVSVSVRLIARVELDLGFVLGFNLCDNITVRRYLLGLWLGLGSWLGLVLGLW